MSIDEQLMRASATATDNERLNSDSAERSGSLREQRRSADNFDEPQDFRQYTSLARRRSEKSNKLKLAASSFKKSISSGTSKLLVAAWRSIIYTFGISFFYVYGHLLLKNLFGDDLFAPLGSEWADRPGITKETRDKIGSKIKLYETLGVIAISVILFILVIFSLTIPALIIEVVKNPLRLGVALLDSFWSWLSNN